jgi:hypothetical protein
MVNNISKYSLWALGGISTVLALLWMFDIVTEDLLIRWCYLLMIITTLAVLGFSLMNTLGNIKKAKNALIGVIGLVVILGISYAVASSEVPAKYVLTLTEGTSKMVGAGIISFYILLVISVVAAIGSGVMKMLK